MPTRYVLRRWGPMWILAMMMLIARSQPSPASAEPSFSCDEVTEVPQQECEALAALYHATGGDAWLENAG